MTKSNSHWLPLLAATATLSCSIGAWPRNAIYHPTPDNLPSPGGPLVRAHTEVTGLTPERAAQWAEMRRALLDARTVTRVGGPTGTAPERLGRVADVAIDDEGNVYILDDSSEEMRVFNADGGFRYGVGVLEDGHGRIRSIRNLEILPDGRLVASNQHGPTRIFEPVDGSHRSAGPLPLDGWTAELAARDMCTIGDRLFFHSTNETDNNKVVYEVSAELDDVIGSFADVYRASVSRIRATRSRGWIACSDDPATVVYGMYYFPIVKAYRPDGSVLWTARIEDFVQGPIYQYSERDAATVHPSGLPTEYIVEVHALAPGFVVLQTGYYERSFPDQDWRMTRLRTYLLDQHTGNGGLVGDNLPRIVWTGDSSYVAAWSQPHAKVEVRALSVP